jgi:peptidoglycan/LPS O-acetylase OafA/YrhL
VAVTSAVRTTSASRRSNRKIKWDIVRTGCVTLVMLYHATFLGVLLHPELTPRVFVFPYQVGASLLLVISAYFACVTIGRGPVLRYWWGRMARLLPPFLGAVVTIFLISRALPIEGWFLPTVDDLVADLLMLWNWKPGSHFYVDGSHWTVPLQVMGFTAAALLFRTRWGHGRRLLGVLWAALLVPIAQWPLRVSRPAETYRTIVDGIGMHRWHLFVAGVAIWLWSTRRIGPAHFAGLLGLCMLAQVVHGYPATDWESTLAVCVGMVVLALTAYGPDWDRFVPEWLARRFRSFAGISYGVFLMHQAVGYLVCRKLHDIGVGPTGQTIAMLCTGVVLGWALTHFVERPAHRFLMNAYDRVAVEDRIPIFVRN